MGGESNNTSITPQKKEGKSSLIIEESLFASCFGSPMEEDQDPRISKEDTIARKTRMIKNGPYNEFASCFGSPMEEDQDPRISKEDTIA
ncbi:hypothetical protein FH972_009425 [Carpinus fangiana]|uniref:Uncharacterized protein n=1 Tax=Carpinus fangiana TaxID=176857 RepID=A0A5N6R2S2_9ROSI|nr:hypothetical protein FH972_009425 [Carpinus fangiana]